MHTICVIHLMVINGCDMKFFLHQLWQPNRKTQQNSMNWIYWVVVDYDCGFDTPTFLWYSGHAIARCISMIANQSPFFYNEKKSQSHTYWVFFLWA